MLLAFAAHGYRFWSQSGVAFWFLAALILARSSAFAYLAAGCVSAVTATRTKSPSRRIMCPCIPDLFHDLSMVWSLFCFSLSRIAWNVCSNLCLLSCIHCCANVRMCCAKVSVSTIVSMMCCLWCGVPLASWSAMASSTSYGVGVSPGGLHVGFVR